MKDLDYLGSDMLVVGVLKVTLGDPLKLCPVGTNHRM